MDQKRQDTDQRLRIRIKPISPDIEHPALGVIINGVFVGFTYIESLEDGSLIDCIKQYFYICSQRINA